MQFKSLCSLVVLVCLAVIFAGCTGSSGPSASSSGGSAASAQNNLVPSPTDAVPSQNAVTVDVGEKDYLGKIPVTFQGGMGQVHAKTVEVTLYTADGQTKTATVGVKKGDMAELPGTKQTDRVVVYVTFDNGTRLKTNDVLSPYRTRQ
jgi:hypothetical protein